MTPYRHAVLLAAGVAGYLLVLRYVALLGWSPDPLARLLIGYYAVKLPADVTLYVFWPDEFPWPSWWAYLGEDALTYLRFALPLSVVQFLLWYTLPIASALLQGMLLWPWPALIVYAVNRHLIAQARARAYRPGDRLRDLP